MKLRRIGILFLCAGILSGCKDGMVLEPEKKDGEEAVLAEASQLEPVSYEGDEVSRWRALLEENEISESFRTGLARFAFDSGSAVLRGQSGNGVYSPLSLYYALAIAGYGAEGETEQAVLTALGVESREKLAEQCEKLYRWYVYDEAYGKARAEAYGEEVPDSALKLSNSLWVSDQLKPESEYFNDAAERFYASSYQADFRSSETGKRIGNWISEQTEGVLSPELSLDPETLLAIVNTLYFYGGWTTPFREENTKDDLFFLEDGSEITVPFLNRTEELGSFYRGDGFTAAALNTNHSCRMVFLLPDEERNAEEFLKDGNLLREALDSPQEEWTAGEVVWKIPKFSFGSSMRLKETLASLGMGRMFDPALAEFGRISQEGLYVSDVIQEAHLGIDEEGVEGAAYTMLMLSGAGLPQEQPRAEMILNRPFLFGIQDQANDIWLFLGVCRDPSSEETAELVASEISQKKN